MYNEVLTFIIILYSNDGYTLYNLLFYFNISFMCNIVMSHFSTNCCTTKALLHLIIKSNSWTTTLDNKIMI